MVKNKDVEAFGSNLKLYLQWQKKRQVKLSTSQIFLDTIPKTNHKGCEFSLPEDGKSNNNEEDRPESTKSLLQNPFPELGFEEHG